MLVAAPAAFSPASDPATPPSAGVAASEPVAPVDFAGEIDDLLQVPAGHVASQPDVPTPNVPTIDEAMLGGSTDGQATFAGETIDSLAANEPSEAAAAAAAEAELVSAPSRLMFAVWTFAGIGVCFVAGVLGAAWWTSGADNATSVADTAKPAVATQPGVDRTTSAPPAVASAEDSSTVPQVETPEVAVNEVTPDTSTNRALAEQGFDKAESETPSPEIAVASLPALPAPTTGPPPAESVARAPETNAFDPLPPLDPLALDSANLDLLLAGQSDPAGNANAAENNLDEQEQTEPIATVAPQRRMRFEPGTAALGPSFVENFGDGELEARLSGKLPAVRWQNVPLHLALDELSSIAGVPITLDSQSLRMAAISARQPVTIELEEATIRQVADSLAKSVRMSVVTQPGGLVLTKANKEKVREIAYPVDDLTTISQPNAQDVAALVGQFTSVSNWRDAAKVDGNKLRITQPASAHYDILLFCERLRKARGLSARSKYPHSLIQPTPRLAALEPRLAKTTTFAFVDWTPLIDVIVRWQDGSRIVMLTDWRALADQDLRPMTTMAGSVENQPWHEALDRCLEPLELGWYPVDDTTIQITTFELANEFTWTEFYATDDPNSLRGHLAEQCDESALATLVVAPDATDKFVIVRGNRQIHQTANRLFDR